MRVEFEFYATLRDAVGEKTVERDLEAGTTVAGAVEAVAGEYDGLEPLVFREDGDLRPNVTVSVNGQPLADGGADVGLETGDRVVIAPSVAGGDRDGGRMGREDR